MHLLHERQRALHARQGVGRSSLRHGEIAEIEQGFNDDVVVLPEDLLADRQRLVQGRPGLAELVELDEGPAHLGHRVGEIGAVGSIGLLPDGERPARVDQRFLGAPLPARHDGEILVVAGQAGPLVAAGDRTVRALRALEQRPRLVESPLHLPNHAQVRDNHGHLGMVGREGSLAKQRARS